MLGKAEIECYTKLISSHHLDYKLERPTDLRGIQNIYLFGTNMVQTTHLQFWDGGLNTWLIGGAIENPDLYTRIRAKRIVKTPTDPSKD